MKKNLNKYGLMQLRIYAKNIGVKAPTAFTKTELIKKINENSEIRKKLTKLHQAISILECSRTPISDKEQQKVDYTLKLGNTQLYEAPGQNAFRCRFCLKKRP